MKREIAKVFMELLELYPYEEISIHIISEALPISRQTFYNHFHSKVELTEWIMTQEYMEKALPLFSYHLKEKGTAAFFEYIKKSSAFYRRIYEVDGGELLSRCLIKTYNVGMDHTKEYSRPAMRGLDARDGIDPQVYRCYTASGIAAVVVYWVGGNMEIPTEKIARDLYLMMEEPLGYVRDNYFVKSVR